MAAIENYRLLIMRHAKSDWDAGIDRDFDRPLSKRGTREAESVAAWLSSQNLMPDSFICSPAKRTWETAKIVARQLGIKSDYIRLDENLYEATLVDILNVIAKVAGDNRNILLIGHNPGLDSLLCYLANTAPERTDSGKLMTTSALAILDYGPDPVSIKQHSASLTRLLRPKEL